MVCITYSWCNYIAKEIFGILSAFFTLTSACFVPAGSHGPHGWSASYPECAATNQSPVDISDQEALVSEEYQELMLEKFSIESSNQTTMKNTGKTGLPFSGVGDNLHGGFISVFIGFVSFWRRLNSAPPPPHTTKLVEFPVQAVILSQELMSHNGPVLSFDRPLF